VRLLVGNGHRRTSETAAARLDAALASMRSGLDTRPKKLGQETRQLHADNWRLLQSNLIATG
jgi:hypothetical protein